MMAPRTEASLTPLLGEYPLELRPTMAAALAAYFDDLALTASVATLATYRSLLRPLNELEALEDFTTAYCRELVTDRFRRRSSATAVTLRGALSGFGAWLLAQGYALTNPAAGVPRPRHRPKARQILTRNQLRALWQAADSDRMRLALVLMGQGLRRAEVCSVKWGDIRPDGVVSVMGKGGRPRRIQLAAVALPILEANRGPARERVVGVKPNTLYHWIRDLGVRAGVGPISPHRFRHSFATHWMLETGDMEALRTLGGWGERSTMPRHYARAALEEAALAKSRDVGLDLFGEG